jgi:6-phosphogluconolactonase
LGEPSAFEQHGKPAGGAGTDPKRQEGPHAHCVNFSPDGKFAMVADLGLDEVITYKVDGGGLVNVQTAHVAPGSGPRHFALSPSGKVAYVVTELKSTVVVFDFNPQTGALKEKQTISALPSDFKGTSYGAEIAVHPSGRFLYTSNRGSNSIAMFAIENGGKLKFLGIESTRGDWPRNFGIDPTGHWMIASNQNSNTIAVFQIDQKSGKLKPVGNTVQVGSPVDIEFLP